MNNHLLCAAGFIWALATALVVVHQVGPCIWGMCRGIWDMCRDIWGMCCGKKKRPRKQNWGTIKDGTIQGNKSPTTVTEFDLGGPTEYSHKETDKCREAELWGEPRECNICAQNEE